MTDIDKQLAETLICKFINGHGLKAREKDQSYKNNKRNWKIYRQKL